MKTLIITEKREMGTDISSCLNDTGFPKNLETESRKGYLEGNDYIITWAVGHMFRLQTPEEVNTTLKLFFPLNSLEEYKQKDLINTKIIPDITPLPYTSADQNKFIEFKARQFDTIITQLKRKDIEKIILFCDADAEGERIGQDLIIQNFNTISSLKNISIYRAWNTGSNKAKESVEKALKEMKLYTEPKYANLYDSAKGRLYADYLIGMKITKLLSEQNNTILSAGRVQSPIIALICKREDEINNFKPKEYWTIDGIYNKLNFNHFFYKEETETDENGESKTSRQKTYQYFSKLDKDKTSKELAEAKNTGTIEEFTIKKATTKNRPLPFSTGDFQQKIMSEHKVSLEIANGILEYLRDEGFTTYPRTDGNYFAKADSEEVFKSLQTAKKIFPDNKSVQEIKPTTDIYIFNDKEASKQNHTPLNITTKIPTEKDFKTWENITHKNIKLKNIKEGYFLIARRITAAFLPGDQFEQQNIIINIQGHKFELKGEKPLSQGYRDLLEEPKKDTSIPTNFKKGDPITFDEIKTNTKLTEKPKYYTINTLLNTLINITKAFEDEIEETDDPQKIKEFLVLKKALQQAKGIGTEATRKEIIKNLTDRKYIEIDKKTNRTTITELGRKLYNQLPEYLKKIETTAQWEIKLDEIRQGKIDYNNFIQEIDTICMNIIIPDIYNNSKKTITPKNMTEKTTTETNLICPLCKEGHLINNGTVYKCSKQTYNSQEKKVEGCKFAIFIDTTKSIKRKLEQNDIKKLLNNEIIENEGVRLQLDLNQPYFLNRTFTSNQTGETKSPQETKQTRHLCPLCKTGTIVKTTNVYKCSDQKYNGQTKEIEGCKFAIFINTEKSLKRKLTDNDIELLLKNKPIEDNGNRIELDLSEKYFTKTTWNINKQK